MTLRRYTVCSYLPDLKRPDQAYDFAIIAAGPSDVVAVGVSLAALGLKEESPLAHLFIEKTFDLVTRRIQEAIEKLKKDEPALAVLDYIATGSMSNIVYRPFEDEESEDTVMTARRIFSERCLPTIQEETTPVAGLEGIGGSLTSTRNFRAEDFGQGSDSAEVHHQTKAPNRTQRRYQVFEQTLVSR